MWFKRKRKKPFVPLPMEQVMALDLEPLKKYQKAHKAYSEQRIKEIQEQSEAQIRVRQEEADAHSRQVQEQMRQDYEETQRKLREIVERSAQQMAASQEETARMMLRAFSDPAYLARLQQALASQSPGGPGNEQIIEGEILSSEEIPPRSDEETHD